MTAKPDPRLTSQSLKVLSLFLERTSEELAGADIQKATKVSSGTLYPILIRLEEAGWLESQWEQVNPEEVGRPRRRYYKLTALGAAKARAELRQIASPRLVESWA